MIDLSKPWPFGLSRRALVPVLIGLVALIVALYFVDRPLSQLAQAVAQPAQGFLKWLTRWGESDWILVPTFVGWLGAWLLSKATRDGTLAAALRFATISGFIFVGVGLPGLVSALLKRAIGRGRPPTWTEEMPLGFQPLNWTDYNFQSFPSGHATTSFALAAVIGFLWPKAFWPAVAFATLIAVSRVALGHHYLTDVTAGAVLGTLGAYAVRNLFVARGWLFETSADGGIARRPFVPTR